MNPLTYLFPALTATFVVLFFILGLIGENHDLPRKKSKRGKKAVPASVEKKTMKPWPILVLTAVYALIAFLNLGDTKTPFEYILHTLPVAIGFFIMWLMTYLPTYF